MRETLSERIHRLGRHVRAALRGRALDRQHDEEVRFHIESEAAELMRVHGLSPAEAHRRALASFGGVTQTREAYREARGLATFDVISQTLRYAGRSLRRRPGLVAGVAVALGLGVGANAAMFSVIDRLLLSPPPHLRDPSRVGRVYFSWQLNPGDAGLQGYSSGVHVFMPYARYLDLVGWTSAFDDAAVFADQDDEVPVGIGQATREVRVAAVSASFFSFFNAPPAVGRYFTQAEDRPAEGSTVAVLSNAFWHSEYGGHPDIIGKQLLVDRREYTVIGVAPADFVGVGDADEVWQDPSSGYGTPPGVFVPVTTFGATYLTMNDPCMRVTGYCAKWLQMIVRRRPGVSVDVASHDLRAAFQRSYVIQRADAEARNGYEWKRIFPPIGVAKPEAMVGPILAARGPMASATTRVATWVAGVAGIVLAIACANVASLLLASARERRAELALRVALGVSQRRLAGQLLTECLMLACIGAAAALLIGGLGRAILAGMFLPGDPATSFLSQPRTLMFAGAAAVLAGLVTSVALLLQAQQTDVVSGLKGASSSDHPGPAKGRAILLAVQAALSVILLIGAGLFIRSVDRVRAVRLGFAVDPLLYARVDRRGMTIDSTGERELAQRMVDAATGVPGVSAAMRTFGGPFVTRGSPFLVLPGVGPLNSLGDFSVEATTPGYFDLVGTHILRGRDFGSSDVARAPRVAIVSQATADALWPGQDPIGKSFKIGTDTAPSITVVGVAENTIRRTFSDQRHLRYYLPLRQFNYDWGTDALGIVELLIRVRGHARAYETTLRRVLQSVIPGTAYVSLRPVEDDLGVKVRSWHFGATLFLAFGVLALIVAAIGLYSVMANEVATRTHELGVRIALGARVRHLLALIGADSARFAGIGVLVGGLIALGAAPLLAPLLFAEPPRDPVVFGAAAAILIGAAVAAAVAPVLRASHVDPGSALRVE